MLSLNFMLSNLLLFWELSHFCICYYVNNSTRTPNSTCAEQLRSPEEVPSDSGYVSSTANSKPSGR